MTRTWIVLTLCLACLSGGMLGAAEDGNKPVTHRGTVVSVADDELTIAVKANKKKGTEASEHSFTIDDETIFAGTLASADDLSEGAMVVVQTDGDRAVKVMGPKPKAEGGGGDKKKKKDKGAGNDADPEELE